MSHTTKDTPFPISSIIYTYKFDSLLTFISTENDRTTLPDLVKLLTDIRDWPTLAAHILPGNAAGVIKRIRDIHNGNIRECKKALFMEYLETGDKSWSTLMTALISTGNIDLAEDIKQKLGL